MLLIFPKENELLYTLCFAFLATNSEAEYKALIGCLASVNKLQTCQVHVFFDFQIIVNQVHNEYQTNENRMKK